MIEVHLQNRLTVHIALLHLERCTSILLDRQLPASAFDLDWVEDEHSKNGAIRDEEP